MRIVLAFTLATVTILPPAAAAAGDGGGAYRFDGTISRAVLENYLARSITMMDLCTGKGDVDDNIRMLRDTGAMFAGRTVYQWGYERDLERNLKKAREIAARVHAVIPSMVLQAGIFEFVSTQVNDVPVPERVFREFGLAPERRSFRQADMLFEDGRHRWSGGAVPDITRLETRMWFYHLATSYIDAGMEAIHFGQVHVIGENDDGFRNWWDLLGRVRKYAAANARRHMVICDAHTNGIVTDGRLLFDFHSCPLCVKELPGRPQEAVLEIGHGPYRMSKGGLAPSGWKCAALPQLVELDNSGPSGKGGQFGVGWGWVWGYDEIDWFARQPPEYRNEWLRYAWKWLREHDPNTHLQMPGSRILHDPGPGPGWYHANARRHFAAGFDQEDTIRDIWAADGRPSGTREPVAGPAPRKRAAERPKPKPPPKPEPKRATPEGVILFDARLLARVREELAAGGKPAFHMSAMRGKATVTGVEGASTLRVRAGRGVELPMALGKLPLTDRKSLALSVLRDGISADHCLAGFYLIACGEAEAAEEHLARAAKADANEVRSAFSP